jgi:hypothetical protein
MQDELLKLSERVGVSEQRYIVAATLYVLTRSIQTSTCFVTLQGEALDIFHLYNPCPLHGFHFICSVFRILIERIKRVLLLRYIKDRDMFKSVTPLK